MIYPFLTQHEFTMSIYQHILLAVNLTPESGEIALKAKELAQLNHAKLSLVYVLDLPPVMDASYEASLSYDMNITQLLTHSAQTELNRFVEHLELDLYQKWLVEGESVEEIIRIAQDNAVDLIVLGSHGKNGLELLWGSTSNTMLHHARCDVLAVYVRDK